MKIPIRPYNLKYSTSWSSNIVIHHTAEFNLKSGDLSYDKPTSQIGKLRDRFYIEKKEFDPPYHYILEKVGNDYEIIVGRQLFTKCYFKDLLPKYDDSIHIALMGDYNITLPEVRLYQILSYRILIPFYRLLKLKSDSLVTHKEISMDPDSQTCPGEFFDINKLRTIFNGMIRKVALNRKV